MTPNMLSQLSDSLDPIVKTPYPYLTAYYVIPSERDVDGLKLFTLRSLQSRDGETRLPISLHNDFLLFSELVDIESSQRPPDSNNGPWARARRTPATLFTWDDRIVPSLPQLWLIVYALFTVRPEMEAFRVRLQGLNSNAISQALQAVLLAVPQPQPADEKPSSEIELLILRSTFWQGAGSPFGPRPIWVPEMEHSNSLKSLSSFPPAPLDHIMTALSPSSPLSWHPRRPAKPKRGSVIYSRWIPHLKEMFSMVALDYENPKHLNLFHEWQNDPRVSQGWDETGTLEQHCEYLRRAHEDPHQITVLAAFEDTFFAYFEVYWAKEDRLGAYYSADDFDRGRHSLVGDIRFRGPHRVSAWWSSLMHYIFLDDIRTRFVVGEPKATNSTVLSYDFIHGFGLDKFVDLPHKRSAFVRCSRERFFQLPPFGLPAKCVGGTGVGLVPKL